MPGVLSEAENKTIAAGLNDVVMDYFVDAVDRNGATELVFRSGATKTIQPGSWIVNCTGYLSRDSDHAVRALRFRQRGGALDSAAVVPLCICRRSMGYFLTHLLFLDKFRDVPLYELDVLDLRKKSRTAFPYALFTLALHNLSLIYDNVPSQGVSATCGLDFDRLVSAAAAVPGHGAVHAHPPPRPRARAARLDTVRERFDSPVRAVWQLGAGVGAEPVKQ